MELKDKLKKYSLLASATMGGAIAANADINYTDINPDSVLAAGDFGLFDVDADGFGDLILAPVNNFVSVNGYGTSSNQNLLYFSAAPNVGILATSSGVISYVPTALSASTLIQATASANFVTGSGLVGGYVSYQYSTYDFGFGNWNGATDKYLGVMFQDSISPTFADTTYGWVRMTVNANSSSVTILDHGYQTCPGVPILAGDTGNRATSTASNLVLADVADNFDGGDFQLSFDTATDETLVQKYQILVVKASKAGTFTVDSAMALPETSRYYVTPNGSNFSGTLSALGTDTDGDTFAQNESYVVFVLSIPDGTNATMCELSSPSNSVTLQVPASPASNIVASDLANNGNGLDLGFTFDMAADESTVSEYKVIAVKNSKSGSFDLDSAKAAVTANRYTTVPKTGSNLSGNFAVADVDSDGDAIANNVDYNLFVVSCADTANAGEDAIAGPSNTITLTALAVAVSNVVATDVADNNNGTDLQVTFNMAADESSLTEYNAIVVKASAAGTFNVDSANNAIGNSYHLTIPKTGSNLTATFGASDVDSDGDPIMIGVDYVVYIVSVGTGGVATNNISSASNNITLTIPADMATNVVASDVSDNNNSSDLQVTFDMAADESTVTEYRVYVVKQADSAAFDLATAEAVSAGNYLTVAKTGSNLSATFGVSATDVDGDAIAHNTNYALFVMSVADGTNANVNSLSLSSNTVMLTIPITTPVTNVMASDVSENSNGTDLQITFDIPADESGIAEYHAVVVKSASAGTFDLTAAEAAVTAGNYLNVAKTGSNITTTFGAADKDSDGDALTIGVDYVVYVISVNDGSTTTFSSLSGASNNVVLNTTASVATNVVATDASDNGNASDLQVTFDMGANESTVSSYAVMAVKMINAGTFDLAAAEAVSSNNYLDVTPTGSNITTNFAAGAKDVDGSLIVHGTDYQIFVMSIQNGTTSNINSLSTPSSPVSLSVSISDPSNVTAVDVADNDKPSDMEVTFDGIAEEGFISDYEILVVTSSAAATITDAELNQMILDGYGTSVTPDGSSSYTSVLANTAADQTGLLVTNNKAYKVIVAAKGGAGISGTYYSLPSEEVILTNSTGIANALENNVSITSANKTVTVQLDASIEPKGVVMIHNTLGQLVTQVDINSSQTQIGRISKDGIYVVSVVLDDHKISKQVSIR